MNRLIIISVFLAWLCFAGNTQAQHIGCGIDHATQKMYKIHPDLIEKVKKSREAFQAQDKKKTAKSTYKNGINGENYYRTIPMVFHVIHQGGDEKIDKVQIDAAIQDAINDFNMSNADKLTSEDPFYEDQASVGLNFELATKDPYGNATTGVTYTESYFTLGGSNFETRMKDMIHWPNEDYLNIWVVNYVSGASGYAHYPEVANLSPVKDGIVIGYNYLGTTGQADPSVVSHTQRHILAHEIGHWLGLQHTWGDLGPNIDSNFPPFGIPENCNNDDNIDDTPNSIGYQQSDVPLPITSCADLPNDCGQDGNYNGAFSFSDYCGNIEKPDSWADYIPTNIFNMMEYGYAVMFTKGQKTRMHSYLDGNDDLGGNLAGRKFIGIDPSIVHIDDGKETLVADGYYWNESNDDDGSIYNEIVVELSQGNFNFSGGSINQAYVSATNLPAGLTLTVQSIPGYSNKAKLVLSGVANSHLNTDDIESIDVVFYSGAFSGVNTNNLHNFNTGANSITLSNLSINFVELEPIYTRFTLDNLTDIVCAESNSTTVTGDYGAFYLDHAGYMAIQYKDAKFYLVKESGVDVKVATTGVQNPDNTYNAEFYNAGVAIDQIPSSKFKTITRGPEDFILEDIVLNNTSAEKYLAIKITTQETSGPRILYGWLRVGSNGADYCVYDAMYHTASTNLPLQTGELVHTCLSYPLETEVLPDALSIGGFPLSDYMTLDAASYGLELEATPDGYDHITWAVWIDKNKDGYFDYDEARYFLFYIPDDIPTTAGTTYQDPWGNPQIIPGLDLSDLSDGQYTMRVILAPYNFNLAINNRYSINPCMPYEIGSTTDFIINISNQNNGNQPCVNNNLINTSFYWVDGVTLGNINNGNSNNGNGSGYSDYTNSNHTTDLESGQSYTISIASEAFSSATLYRYVWLDTNQDGDFSDETLLYNSSINHTLTTSTPTIETTNGTITIPAGLSDGMYSMRVIVSSAVINNPCTDEVSGEIEDYTINVATNNNNTVTLCQNNNFLNTNFYWVDDFVLEDINNTNSDNGNGSGYSDYTSSNFTTDLESGQSYTISIASEAISSATLYRYVWLDTNQDGDFSDETLLYISSINHTLTTSTPTIETTNGTITVPAGLSDGQYSMRVIVSSINVTNPCSDEVSGEVEDYTVTIVSGASVECCPLVVDYNNTSLPDYTQAEQIITAKNFTVSSGFAVLNAGETILLTDGITINHGTAFYAYILDCNPNQCNGNRTEETENLEANEQAGFTIYPNPSEDRFTLEYKLEQASNVSFEIYNITGKLEKVIIPNEYLEAGFHSSNTIIADLSPGIYLIQGTMGSEKVIQKLVKMQ